MTQQFPPNFVPPRIDPAQDFGIRFNEYPVFSKDLGFEGATKRFVSMPTPDEVFQFAFRGLPKVYPLTGEPVTPDVIIPYLNSALTEIEMSLGFNITPVEHTQAFEYIDGCFEANFSGFKLERWPAFRVSRMQLKFPHVTTVSPYQTYTIPPNWITLSRNKINVVAAFGAIAVSTDVANVAAAGGIFSYITGFARGAYQPSIIEIKYLAGFEDDRLPSVVYDLIQTLAAIRALNDFAPLLFPIAGVNVSIDGVSQSAQLPGPAILSARIAALEKKYLEQSNAVTMNFGRTIKMSFIGA